MQPYGNGGPTLNTVPPLQMPAAQYPRPAMFPAMPGSDAEKAKKTYNFKDQLAVSKYAEELFLYFMQERVRAGKLREVRDVRDSREYRERDIDFVCVERNGREVGYEVKHDTTKTGNMFVETMVNSYTENADGDVIDMYSVQGWLYKSKADRVFYYFEKYRKAILFDRIPVAAWTDSLGSPENLYSSGQRVPVPRVRAAKNIEDRGYGRSYYYGIGYIVPVRDILDAPKLQKHVWRLGFIDENKTKKEGLSDGRI